MNTTRARSFSDWMLLSRRVPRGNLPGGVGYVGGRNALVRGRRVLVLYDAHPAGFHWKHRTPLINHERFVNIRFGRVYPCMRIVHGASHFFIYTCGRFVTCLGMSGFQFALVFHGGHYYCGSDDFPGARKTIITNTRIDCRRCSYVCGERTREVYKYICVCECACASRTKVAVTQCGTVNNKQKRWTVIIIERRRARSIPRALCLPIGQLRVVSLDGVTVVKRRDFGVQCGHSV